MEDTLGAIMVTIREHLSRGVLILVLMEDTLGDQVIEQLVKNGAVLILVLMEDTLGESTFQEVLIKILQVLILVLMEDTLGV